MMLKFLVFILAVASFHACRSYPYQSLSAFQGLWKLDKYESFDSLTGIWFETPTRMGYTGFILYDGQGHMGVELLPPNFRNIESLPRADSTNTKMLYLALALYSSSFEYFGFCSLSQHPALIEHHIISSNHPSEVGTTVKRAFAFRGDTLILTAQERIGGLITRLRWIKTR